MERGVYLLLIGKHSLSGLASKFSRHELLQGKQQKDAKNITSAISMLKISENHILITNMHNIFVISCLIGAIELKDKG